MDPRLAARRRAVAEVGARSRLRRVIWLGMLMAIAGLAVWASQSQLLDVDSVVVHGIDRSSAAAVLGDEGIATGTPIVAAIWRASPAERAIEADPWVRDASVSIVLPDTIELEVVEYQPAAWVGAEGGWMQVAADGAVVARAPAPSEGLPIAELAGVEALPGQVLDDASAAGALEFFAALDPATARRTLITEERDGLWAHVAGRAAKLGRPEEMPAKAAALEALLGEEWPDGWAVNLVAPARPALFDPGATFGE